jgi:hypothetical protein
METIRKQNFDGHVAASLKTDNVLVNELLATKKSTKQYLYDNPRNK